MKRGGINESAIAAFDAVGALLLRLLLGLLVPLRRSVVEHVVVLVVIVVVVKTSICQRNHIDKMILRAETRLGAGCRRLPWLSDGVVVVGVDAVS